MLKKLYVLSSAALLSVFLLSFSTQAATSEKAKNLAQQAASANAAEAKNAIAELRAMGAEGLDALFEVYAAQIANRLAGRDDADWAKIADALDGVAMQKNSYAARLYWQTDFEKARETAKKEGKPILSLRLLGNLNEEFSCANSRFFRTILYANADVSKVLREKYVLHWQSVRPAPKVTIDFGDGRKIERTITGNSIHYILDKDGKPLDALPRLNSPQAFLHWLSQANEFYGRYQQLAEKQKPIVFRNYHQNKLAVLRSAWQKDLSKVEKPPQPVDTKNIVLSNPSAVRAMPIAATKMITEVDILRSITTDIEFLKAQTDIDEWRSIAALYVDTFQLDKNSVSLIQWQINERKPDSNRLPKLLVNLRNYIALDTVRNNYLIRTKLNEWFARGEASNLDKLNERVYAELFLTPRSDEWLGLYSPEVYTALDGEGIK